MIFVYKKENEESKVEYRELMPDEIKAQFGNVSEQELLEPERLIVIFGEGDGESHGKKQTTTGAAESVPSSGLHVSNCP